MPVFLSYKVGECNISERDGQTLNVHFTKDLLQLTAKIAHGIAKNRGHLLLIGKSGVGRKTSIKILSALFNHKLFIPVLNDSLSLNNDLKMAMQAAALTNEVVYLIFEDHVFTKPGILSLVNTLIFSGEVPGLYNTAEIDSLVAGLKEEASHENFDGNLIQFFAESK